jgi:hypothetical protein
MRPYNYLVFRSINSDRAKKICFLLVLYRVIFLKNSYFSLFSTISLTKKERARSKERCRGLPLKTI